MQGSAFMNLLTSSPKKDSPKQVDISSNLTGQKVVKRQIAAQRKLDHKPPDMAPMGKSPIKTPKKKPEIKSDMLNKLNAFLCQNGGELSEEQRSALQGLQSVKKAEPQKEEEIRSQPTAETTNDSSPNKPSNKDYAKELAEKLIATDGNQKQGNKPLSKMSKKDQLACRQQPSFLKEENRMDKNERHPDDPEYDPATLLIPSADFAALSDGMKRYWEIKTDNMDKLLLYRFGDWYVFYYDDLDAAAKLIDLTLVPQPGVAQVGFEVSDLERNIKRLTDAGHKVAVCEQTETRDMMDNRLKAQMEEKKETKKIERQEKKEQEKKQKEEKNQMKLMVRVKTNIQPENLDSSIDSQGAAKEEQANRIKLIAPPPEVKPDVDMLNQEAEQAAYDTTEVKAVRRAITNVYSKGTYNPAVQQEFKLDLGKSRGATKEKIKYDDVMGDQDRQVARQINEQNENIRDSFDDRYILVFFRKDEQIGFVFYDISILHFYVGCFLDTKTCVNDFRTLVQTLKPVEAVTLYNENSRELVKMLKNMQQRPILSYLTNEKILDITKVDQISREYAENNTNINKYPDGLENMFESYYKNAENKDELEIQLSVIGLSFAYMKEMMMAEVAIPFASFKPYQGISEQSFLNTQTNMILDSATQESLEIFNNQPEDENNDKKQYKSLVDLLDQTSTPFGRRLLRKWLSAPLTDINQITQRQEAVADLLDNYDIVKQFRDSMHKQHDLERLLARCYSYSIKSQQQIVYEELIWNLRLTEFRKTLVMLDSFVDLNVSLFEHVKRDFKSERLRNLVTFKNVAEPPPENEQEVEDLRFGLESKDGLFHNYSPVLKPFHQCIQWEKVENDRFMPRPMKGMDDEIDEILISMDKTKGELNDYLQKQKQVFSCERISFASNRKYRYQLEIPNENCEQIDECDEFFITARLKNVKRYLSSELTNLTTQLSNDELMYKARISPLIRDMFERFYHNREHWSSAVKCLAEVDALCALATVSNNANMVQPIILPMCDKPFMNISQMRHPLIELTNENFIANDLTINYDDQRVLLITGPNMGGKSTTLRTTCLIVIMAQMGCHVPCDSCEFSIVDYIFTRVGANDKILENKSTFFMELEETKHIIDYATKNSLVIMDELGRGTSTFDGYSLANSVLKYVMENNQSRMLFTTHYHWLVDDFKTQKFVNQFTMLIDQSEEDDDVQMVSPNKTDVVQQNLHKKVRFLYKFVPGVSLSSFGVSVAQMAGIDKCILDRATQKSNEFRLAIKSLKEQSKKQ